ncbi:MAG: sugar-binding transcriptional regulator [Thermoanaerobacterales bacterium]|jgi:central glycolytic genes regulator|nr:sugar-binding transcriptional regulator [Thermoanaerobacterales bacterium]
MQRVAKMLKRIAPELAQTVDLRYIILRNIYFNQPIGRRALSSVLSKSERTLRAEVKRLEGQGLLEIDPRGMKVTNDGERIITDLENFMFYLKGLNTISEEIKCKFGCKDVIIVSGNSDEDKTIIKELGKEAADFLKSSLKDGDIIAVTGGTTIAQIPKFLNSTSHKNVVIVPGRGGLGEKVEIQPNTIAAELAKKLGVEYELLYVPDNLGSAAMDSVVNEPSVREVISVINNATILLHGIGGAEEMASRRGMSREQVLDIINKGAVAEAFGFYFSKEGKIVHTTTSIGLSAKALGKIRTVIAVAGGANKAPAIQAFLRYHQPSVLITDEGAARRLLEIEGGDNHE